LPKQEDIVAELAAGRSTQGGVTRSDYLPRQPAFAVERRTDKNAVGRIVGLPEEE
jgi:hypothetical protein